MAKNDWTDWWFPTIIWKNNRSIHCNLGVYTCSVSVQNWFAFGPQIHWNRCVFATTCNTDYSIHFKHGVHTGWGVFVLNDSIFGCVHFGTQVVFSVIPFPLIRHQAVTCILYWNLPDSQVHGANMRPIWVLTAPDGPHVGPMNLAIRAGAHLVRHGMVMG